MTPTMTTSQNTIPIQIGESTHSQLHVITLVNFNTMNATVNKPANPIPELLLDEFDIIFNF